MGFSVLVAEPENDDWTSIADGIRRRSPDALILRVKDGEQAVRFLFHRGLFTEGPETPDLVVLAANLSIVSTEAVVTRIRQHPRTRQLPVVVVWREQDPEDDELFEVQDRLDLQHPMLIVGAERLERAVAEAVQRLCRSSLDLDDRPVCAADPS